MREAANQPLQPTGAAIPVLRDMTVLQAAPAAELGRSATGGPFFEELQMAV